MSLLGGGGGGKLWGKEGIGRIGATRGMVGHSEGTERIHVV